jgi:RNA polymerase sigma factor (sigma-70 family)
MIAPNLPPLEFVPHPLFGKPSAERSIERMRPKSLSNPAIAGIATSAAQGMLPERLPEPLSRAEERYLFCRMNFLKYRAHRLRKRAGRRAPRRGAECSREYHACLREAEALRNRIVSSNVRLIAALAGRHARPDVTPEELLSEGCLPLLRAVDLFDVSRGLCFSTYATHAIRNHLFRHLQRSARRGRKHLSTDPRLLDETASDRGAIPDRSLRRKLIARLLRTLPEREQLIVSARWGLADDQPSRTYEQIGHQLGLSKERVRVLAHRALSALQSEVSAQRLEFPE